MKFLMFQDEFWSGFRFLYRTVEAASFQDAVKALALPWITCTVTDEKQCKFTCSDGHGRDAKLRLIPIDDLKPAEEHFLDKYLREKFSDGGH